MLHNIVLQEHTINRWRWILDPINGYSVKGTYQCLTMLHAPPERGLFDVVWQKYVPSKVSVLAWRLLRNRLPTKGNLVQRRVLHQDDSLCVGGCGYIETTLHLFLGCNIYGSVWILIYQWLGISFIAPDMVSDHLLQFGTCWGYRVLRILS